MIPPHLRPFFWDVYVETFRPEDHPEYTIGRILEYGDKEAMEWLRENFSEAQLRQVVRTERRLSRRSANFWAVVFKIPRNEVAALKSNPSYSG